MNACTSNASQEKVLDGVDSSESIENESGIQTGFSLSTSVAVNSDLTSPDVPTISLNSVSSKESPTRPICNLTNGKSVENVKVPSSTLNSAGSLNYSDEEAVWNQRYD